MPPLKVIKNSLKEYALVALYMAFNGENKEEYNEKYRLYHQPYIGNAKQA